MEFNGKTVVGAINFVVNCISVQDMDICVLIEGEKYVTQTKHNLETQIPSETPEITKVVQEIKIL